jgi:hypothetical protein
MGKLFGFYSCNKAVLNCTIDLTVFLSYHSIKIPFWGGILFVFLQLKKNKKENPTKRLIFNLFIIVCR